MNRPLGPEAPELIGASPRVHARVTGLVGLVMLASGSFAGFVGSKLLVRGDPIATARNIVASESLFRLGLASGLVMMIAFLFYGLFLYRLLAPVDRNRAATMLALVLVSVPIYMLNEVHPFAALLAAADQRHDQVKLLLEMHRFGNLIAAVFFGLWLLPFGLLVFRSGFFPRFLGVLLVIGTPGYLALSVQGFLFPGSEGTVWTSPLLLVTHLSEGAMLLWLLIRGVNADAWARRVRS